MKKTAIAAVVLASFSGWGALLYYVHELRPAEEQRLTERVLTDLEHKWSFQDSLKQEEETQRRNVLFVRQREFERQVEEETARQRGALAQMTEEYRRRADEAFRTLNESLRAELEKADALARAQSRKQAEESRALLDGLRAELRQGIEQAAAAAAAADKEAGARRKDIAVLRAAFEREKARMAELGADVKSLQEKLAKVSAKLDALAAAVGASPGPNETAVSVKRVE